MLASIQVGLDSFRTAGDGGLSKARVRFPSLPFFFKFIYLVIFLWCVLTCFAIFVDLDLELDLSLRPLVLFYI